MPITQKHRTIAIGTPLGEDVLLLRSFSSVEALGRPFEYQLELGSEKADIAFKDILGQNVTIRLELPGSGTRYFNGIVSRFGHAGQRGRVFYYHATVVPWLWLLSRASDCRIFQEMTGPDIIRKVFRDRGFTDFRENLSASYRKWEYCVQYRETDFNFVSRLMEQEGIYYYFEHENGKHTMVLCDSVSAHKPFAGYDSVLFRPFDDGVHKRDFVYEWRVEENLQPGAYELNDFDFKKPKKALIAKSQQPAPHAFADLPLYDYPGEYTEFSEGQQYAQVRLQGLHAQYHVYHGQANARGLCTGSTFKLAECPVTALNQEYLITQTSYTVRGDAFEADASAAGGEFCSVRFSAVTAATPYRSSPVTPKPIVQGPQTALVVGKAGEEIWTDQFGRVKVKFHWDRYSKADENSSCWIRVSQNWASKKWGTFFLPRIGQEVIVEFLEGDPDRPIVTGCVYNGDAPTPYDLPKEATKSTLKSNTSKGGNGFNEIRFEDKKGKEQIFIHGQRDLDVRIRDDIRETNYGNRDIRVGWEKDGVKGGDLNTLVRKDVNTHVQGGQFEQVDKQLNQTVKEDVVEDYQKNQTTLVKDVYQLNAKEIVIEGGQVISQKSGKILIQGAQGVHIKGAKVAIEGSAGVSLKVGGNFVSVSPAGVAIKGSMVMINSGGSGAAAESANAVEAPEIKEPFEARRADDGKTGGPVKVSASPIQILKRKLTTQKAPDYVPPPLPPAEAKAIVRPPIPPPAAPVSSTCSLSTISAECSHRKTGVRRVIEKGVLQVVPDKTLGSDTITLKATAKSPCGNHPQWLITDEPLKTGASQTFNATAPTSSKIWIPRFSPRVYSVTCRACNGADLMLDVEAFSPNQLSLTIDAKKFSERFPSVADAIASVFSLLLGRFHLDLPLGELKAEAYWKEHTDHRAYYFYSVTAEFQRLFGVDLTFTLGPDRIGQMVGKIPFIGRYAEKFIDSLVKAGVDITIEGKAGLSLSWERKSPDATPLHQGIGAGLTGEIGLSVSIGAKILGGDVIQVGLKGESIVFAGEAKPFGDDEGLGVEFSAKHKGLTVGVTFELLWGIVAIDESAVLIEEGRDPYLGPSKLYLLSNSH